MDNSTDWLLFAETDLRGAKLLLQENITNLACLHAQQAVEKCLKSVLSKYEQEIPKIHNLLPLLEKTKSYVPDINQFTEACEFLTQFYIPVRYPDIITGSLAEKFPTTEDAKQTVEYAEDIFKFTKKVLEKGSTQKGFAAISSHNRGFAPILILLVGVLIGGAIVGAYYFDKNFQSTPNSSQIIPVPSSTATPDETANWKTYTSQEFNYEILVPTQTEIKIMNDDYNKITFFTNENFDIEVRLKNTPENFDKEYFYLDFAPTKKEQLPGGNALVFEAPNGYCDGPGCGEPFIAFSLLKGSKVYNIVFYGDTKLSELERKALDTFKFTN